MTAGSRTVAEAKRYARGVLGPELWQRIAQQLGRVRDPEAELRKQPLFDVQVGDFRLRVPAGHPFLIDRKVQPRRDLAVGWTAAAIAVKYPGASIVDVGANLGDTAAIAASASPCPLILVEPSDYWHALLVENAARIPTVRRVEQVLLGTSSSAGHLVHWGATAYFVRQDGEDLGLPVKALGDVADPDTRFVKIDTDGFDYAIIQSAEAWLASARPVVYFEADVCHDYVNRTVDDVLLADAVATIDSLERAGYTSFSVFDDPGNLMVAGVDGRVVTFLLQWLRDTESVSNFDILAVPADDRDVLDAVTTSARTVQ